MKAIGMKRDTPGIHVFELPKPKIEQPDEVLVRIKEVAIDGTDYNMVRYNLQDIAEGRNEIVVGHEAVGIVEEVGHGVETLAPGDVVTMTVRRGCGRCLPCLHDHSDMCMTGLYTERGIHRLDGFLTEFILEQERYVLKVPPALKREAMFIEPLSIAEKGIQQIRAIQSRFPWACNHPSHSFKLKTWGSCKTVLVVGAGPLGLMATVLFRLAGTSTFVDDIFPDDHPKAELVRSMGANYIDGRGKNALQLIEACCGTESNLDMIFEASGAAETALQLMLHMSRSSIYVMTGIPRGGVETKLDASEFVRQLVRYNQVVVGSVNSNRSHFEMAARDMAGIHRRFPGIFENMVTRRVPMDDYKLAFQMDDPKHIKTIMEIDPWE